ncbi:hypothetical protein AAMO2058_000072000 [Amorphochlora amoebiformis]
MGGSGSGLGFLECATGRDGASHYIPQKAYKIYPRCPKGLILRPVCGIPSYYKERLVEQYYYHADDGKTYSYDLTYKRLPNHGMDENNCPVRNNKTGVEAFRVFKGDKELLAGFLLRCKRLCDECDECGSFVVNAPTDPELAQVFDGNIWAVFKLKNPKAPRRRRKDFGQHMFLKKAP